MRGTPTICYAHYSISCPLFASPALATTEEPLDFTVQFSPNERQLYGFDAKDHDAFNNYEKAQLQDEEYPIAWKSIEAGRVDYVNATAEGKTAFPGFIGFKTPSMPMASQPADQEAEKQVNLVGEQCYFVKTI